MSVDQSGFSEWNEWEYDDGYRETAICVDNVLTHIGNVIEEEHGWVLPHIVKSAHAKSCLPKHVADYCREYRIFEGYLKGDQLDDSTANIIGHHLSIDQNNEITDKRPAQKMNGQISHPAGKFASVRANGRDYFGFHA